MGCNNKTDLPQLLRCMTRRPRTPVPLQRLTLSFCWNNAQILHGLFSLFSVDTLVIDPAQRPKCLEKSAAHIKALFPPASVTLQSLVIRENTKPLYEFLERVLVPGGLRGFATGPWLREDLPYIHQFLRSPAARNLLSISVMGGIEDLHGPHLAATGTPLVRKIPSATLAQCTHVQYFRFGLAHYPHTMYPGRYFPTPLNSLRPLLVSLPASLRAFSLHVWIAISPGWDSVVAGWNTAIESFAVVDRWFDPAREGRRFRHLRRVELHVHFWSWNGETFRRNESAAEKRARQDIERVADPLPRLRAAGLLREFRVDDVVCDPDKRNFMPDVYWPSDLET
ncbi:hypothetical protein GSI_11454 [Ganoderma sinense ZZ0214-1]|uniref:Uncharacterized protein n=1 Tax=Ganoderma sinense ZZ0214-1 TaxID=1077348 RepID=A0A2G8RW48_9APHY|nr:hypothetical protein GSI_11454 [Ganoderma sinense ZZ0214-1]